MLKLFYLRFHQFLKFGGNILGSRSSFKNINAKDFTFVENGKTYRSIGGFDNVRILIKENGSIKAPEFSHTENRIYAIIQNGALKHLAYYDENHKQAVSIDLLHPHHGVQPHKHLYLERVFQLLQKKSV